LINSEKLAELQYVTLFYFSNLLPAFAPVEGENFLFEATAKASAKTSVIFKGYASFLTGLESIICCNDGQQARKYADQITSSIYMLTNSMGHIIDSFGIHIGELTNDERTLEAVMADMMTRSMAARGINQDSN
jgi:hypothetical protein